jgi:hypothetical protein
MFGFGVGPHGTNRAPHRSLSLGCQKGGIFIGLYAALVLAIPLASTQPEVTAPTEPESLRLVPVVTPKDLAQDRGLDRDRDREMVKALAGVWMRYERGTTESDPLRFYYFHGDGKGLYRYGKTGLNNTHSFDYDVEGGVLHLRFRKTNRQHDVTFRVDKDGEGRDRLTLVGDPEESGQTSYVRETEGPIEHLEGPPPSGHMWIDLQPYATGGCGFHFYQLRDSGIDGRGVGWFHRGDFDDWSTEGFTYRITGNTIELDFTLAGQRESTTFEITKAGDQRVMTLAADPRDFWHEHRYVDAGKSFGMLAASGCADQMAMVAGSAHMRTE